MSKVSKPHSMQVLEMRIRLWIDDVYGASSQEALDELIASHRDLEEQLEVYRETLRVIGYDGPNPGLRRSPELQWAADIARSALASNPASGQVSQRPDASADATRGPAPEPFQDSGPGLDQPRAVADHRLLGPEHNTGTKP